MTNDHILTVREVFPCMLNSFFSTKIQEESFTEAQTLSCASIADLTAFRLPSAEQSWCILVSLNYICQLI